MTPPRELNVLNIINNVGPVNFGIWNAALSTAGPLNTEFNIKSFLFASGPDSWENGDCPLEGLFVTRSPKWSDFCDFLTTHRLFRENTIAATHGCWSFPSRWGSRLSSEGYRWIACPHGMLEPWSLNQSRLRKLFYYHVCEGPSLRKASIIRAVSSTERDNLQKLFPRVRVTLIPNGISSSSIIGEQRRADSARRILFLGRLHEKKCPTELTLAFCQSPLSNNLDYELVLAGPDQGERNKIIKAIAEFQCSNVRILDPVYGRAKDALLASASFFALPSHSEGFPTSVVEAMGAGCVPLISNGCNFPEAFEAGLSYQAEPTVTSIKLALAELPKLSPDELSAKGLACANFISQYYTTQCIARCYANICQEL